MKRKELSRVYGAYGSNMNVEQMRMRCPHARVLGIGVLENYRLTFRGCGRGVANVERTRGRMVPIVLWEITPECEQALDLYEGFPRLYVKRVVNVLTSEGHVIKAMIYVMAQQYEKCPAEPSGAYLSTICQGYFANHLELAPLKEALLENKHERGCQEEKQPRGWWKTGRRL